MPFLARLHYRREMSAWLFLSIMMATIEGGVTSVIARDAFAGTVSPRLLEIAVATLQGAPAFANIASLFWTGLAHGRHKIRFLVALQFLAVLLIGQVAFAPRTEVGLVMLLIAGVGGRTLWSGVVTMRATVWRQNFPRESRAMVAGKIATVQALMIALVSVGIGQAQDVAPWSYRVIYPVAAALGIVGVVIYRQMRVRGHRHLLRRERTAGPPGIATGVLRSLHVLRDDPAFGGYMLAMSVFGIGNLAVGAPLVLMMKDHLAMDSGTSIAIIASIPIFIMPLAIPFWSQLLDRMHIVQFRVYHCWSFVVATALIVAAAVTMRPEYLYAAAVAKGIAIGGGVLGWNLGHHDFASPERTSEYMSVHVTLTGVRGLIGPFVAVIAWSQLEAASPGSGMWVFVGCLALNVLGALGFIVLWRSIRSNARHRGT